MITRSIQTTTGKLRIQIPENLSEITIGQMIEMEKADGNEIPLIPGLTRDVADNMLYEDLITIRERVLSLAHQIKYAYQSSQLPEYIVFGTYKTRWGFIRENRIKVPGNLSIEPAGAYMACRDLIADEINKHIEQFGEDDWQSNFTPSLECCCGLLAHYFYCPVTKQLWNEQRAEQFKSEIKKLPVSEALPVARFFFLTYPNWSISKMGFWQAFRLTLKKKLASKRLEKSGISTL